MSAATVTKAKRRVLVVDDEDNVTHLVSSALRFDGFETVTADSGLAALAAVAESSPDLIVLDMMMPGLDGMGVLQRLRANGAQVPVIFLTARDAASDRIGGLRAGADDYVVKPFSLAEIMARVRALLRSVKREDAEGQVLRFQELLISGHDYRLTIEGKPVALRGSEYRLLEFLVRHPERAFSRTQLLDRVWGRDSSAEERAIDVTVQRLRKALARHACEQYIQTVRGVGYRISSAPAAREPITPVD